MSSCHTPEPGIKAVPTPGQLASTMPNMIISLALICSLMAAILAGVYLVTKPQIEQTAILREETAVKNVLPEFDNHPADEVRWFDKNGQELDSSKPDNALAAVVRIYPASKDGKAIGSAIKTFSDKGYAKRIIVMVGIQADGTLLNLSVMEQGETPGLGTKITGAAFLNQFIGKVPADYRFSVKKDGGDVDAITAATISSRAVCDAVQRAYAVLGGEKNE